MYRKSHNENNDNFAKTGTIEFTFGRELDNEERKFSERLAEI